MSKMKKKTKSYFYLGSGEKNVLGSLPIENRYDNEEYVFDIHSKNDGHTAIARRVKEKSCVLDIGCASGLMGKLLKDFKHCTVDGIEYDKKAAEVAKKRGCYRDVFSFSITEEKEKKYQQFFAEKRKYDALIFCDVLEHLDKPWEVLQNFSSLLKKDGDVYVSLPNIAHIDTIRSLVNQEFNYSPLGLLDSTHIRFFTVSSFVDMLKNMGESRGIYFNAFLYEQIIIPPTYLDRELPFSYEEVKDFLVLQNIFDLTLAPSKEKVQIKVPKRNPFFFEEVMAKWKNLERENAFLQEQNEALKEDLQKVLGSKRWKFVSKLASVKELLKKKESKNYK